MAENETDGSVKALGTAISKKIDTSVAAAVGINSVVSTTTAMIGDRTEVDADGVKVKAGTTEGESSDLIVWGMAGAGGSDYGIAGSVAVNVGVLTSTATIGESAVISSSGADGSVTVEALSDVGVQSLAGGFGIGGEAGVGVAASINVVTESTTASIENSASVDAERALTVKATATVAPSTELEIFGKELDLSLVKDVLPMAIAAGGGIATGSDGEDEESTEVSVGGGLVVNTLVQNTKAMIGENVAINQHISGDSEQSLILTAENETRITGGAFGLAGGGDDSFGIGVGVNVVVDNSTATIGLGSTVQTGGDVSVTAISDDELIFLVGSFALSTSSEGGVGASGSLAVYSLTNSTKALIESATDQVSSVDATGDVIVSATSESDIYQLAGSVAGSAGDAGVGVSVGMIVHIGNVAAEIGDSAQIWSNDLSLTATADDTILNVAIGGAGSDDTAAGAAVAVTTQVVDLDAALRSGVSVVASGDVVLTAAGSTQLDAISFGGAGAGEKAGGGAAAVNVVTNSVDALIDAATVTADGSVSLSATSTPIIRGLSVGASGAGKVAVSVTALGNVIIDNVHALITGSTILAGGGVSLMAKDVAPLVLPAWSLTDEQQAQVDSALEGSPIELDANILALNISVAGSGETAVSGALMGNDITNTVISSISGSTVRAGVTEDGTVTNADADIILESVSDTGITALSVGVAGSGTTAVQASGFGNVIVNSTKALVDESSTLVSGDEVELSAQDQSQIRSIALSVAASGSNAVSVLIGANVIVNHVEAVISGSTVDSSGALTLSAVNDSDILSFTGGVAATGTNSVMTSLSVNVVANTTRALIEADGNGLGSVIEADGAMLLTATDSSTIDAFSFGVSASGSNAVGVAASNNDVANIIKSGIDGSQVTGGSTLDINANSSAGVHTLALGVAGSGSVAVQVTAMGNVVANSTSATINDSLVTTAGSLSLTAKDDDPSLIPDWLLPAEYLTSFNAALEGTPLELDANILAVNISIAASSTVAVNAALTGNLIANSVMTNISHSTVLSENGNIILDSDTNAGILSLTVGVAGSGSVSVGASGFGNVIANTTKALISEQSDVEAAGAVSLSADDSSIIRTAGISVSGSGAVAVGALIGANVISNNVVSEISGSEVRSDSTLDITASNTSNILSLTTGVAGSGTASVMVSLSGNVVSNTTSAGISDSGGLQQTLSSTGEVRGSFVLDNVDLASDSITLGSNSELETGDTLIYRRSGGEAIGGLDDGTTYYVIVADDGSIQLATTRSDALAGNAVDLYAVATSSRLVTEDETEIDLTVDLVELESDAIQLGAGHGLATGDTLVYNRDGAEAIGGLVDGVTYYVIAGADGTIQLAASSEDAANGVAIDLGETDTDSLLAAEGGTKVSFSLSGDVDADANTINVSSVDDLETGDALTYSNESGVSVTGLEDGTTYYVIVAADGNVQLAATRADALAGNALDLGETVVIGSTIDAGGAVSLAAEDNSEVNSIAIGVSASGGGAVGVALATNVIANDTLTTISNTQLDTDSSLTLESISASIIRTVAVGVAGAGGFAVQVTALGNVVANRTGAEISGSTVTATGDVSLIATEESPSMIALVDAISEYFLDADILSGLNDALSGTPLDPTANILSLNVSVAASSSASVNMAFTGNVIANSIRTQIDDSTVVSAAGDVILTTTSSAGILALTVGVAASGGVSVNASGFGNVITNNVDRYHQRRLGRRDPGKRWSHRSYGEGCIANPLRRGQCCWFRCGGHGRAGWCQRYHQQRYRRNFRFHRRQRFHARPDRRKRCQYPRSDRGRGRLRRGFRAVVAVGQRDHQHHAGGHHQ